MKGQLSVKKKVIEKVLKENVQVLFERLSGIRALRSRSSARTSYRKEIASLPSELVSLIKPAHSQNQALSRPWFDNIKVALLIAGHRLRVRC